MRLGTEVEAARVGESRGAFAPVFSTTLGRSSNVDAADELPARATPASTSRTCSRRPACASGCRGAPARGACRGTRRGRRRTARSSSFDPNLQSGLQFAFSQPLLRDRTIDAARQQYIVAKRNQQSSELRFRESVVQTVAAVKQAYWTLKAHARQRRPCSSDRSSSPRSSRGRTDPRGGRPGPPLDLVQARGRSRAAAREPDSRRTRPPRTPRIVLRRLIMDPADASFWSVRLDPIEEPAARASLPDVEAAVAKALERTLRPRARAATTLEKRRGRTSSSSPTRSCPTCASRRRIAAAVSAARSCCAPAAFPGTVVGRTAQSSFGDALGQAFSPRLPDVERRRHRELSARAAATRRRARRRKIERQQAAQRIASLRLDAARSVRQAARQVQSTAERVDAARAGATLAEQRFNAEQRRYQAGLSTTFLVTQAQRDLLQAQVNLLQATLDYQSALVGFEALQLAPAVTPGERVALRGYDVVALPAATPRGLFRTASDASIQ